jgi:hypothetical protein
MERESDDGRVQYTHTHNTHTHTYRHRAASQYGLASGRVLGARLSPTETCS